MGASAAASKLAATVKTELSRAFDDFKSRATAALDAVHSKNLQAISDAQKLADAQETAAEKAIHATVDAAQKKIDAERNAQQQTALQQAVADALAGGDIKAIEAAQQALSNFLEDQGQARLAADADAKIAQLQADKAAADEDRKAKVVEEDKKYKAQKTALDKQLTLLKQSLDDQKASWAAHLNAVLKIIGDKDPAFAASGKATGKAYADSVAAAIRAGKADIDAAVAAVTPSGGGTGTGTTKPTEKSPIDLSNGGVGKRASGGPVAGGSPYIVGERGPELFVPGRSGSVVPNGQIGGFHVGSITIQAGYYAGSQVQAAQHARDIFDQLEDEARRRGYGRGGKMSGALGIGRA